jgi:hypothetical protein
MIRLKGKKTVSIHYEIIFKDGFGKYWYIIIKNKHMSEYTMRILSTLFLEMGYV